MSIHGGDPRTIKLEITLDQAMALRNALDVAKDMASSQSMFFHQEDAKHMATIWQQLKERVQAIEPEAEF